MIIAFTVSLLATAADKAPPSSRKRAAEKARIHAVITVKTAGTFKLKNGLSQPYAEYTTGPNGLAVMTERGAKQVKWSAINAESLPGEVKESHRVYVKAWLQRANYRSLSGRDDLAHRIYKSVAADVHYLTKTDHLYLALEDLDKKARGLVKTDGKWRPVAEVMKKRGYVEVGGRWITAEKAAKLRAAKSANASDVDQQRLRQRAEWQRQLEKSKTTKTFREQRQEEALERAKAKRKTKSDGSVKMKSYNRAK